MNARIAKTETPRTLLIFFKPGLRKHSTQRARVPTCFLSPTQANCPTSGGRCSLPPPAGTRPSGSPPRLYNPRGITAFPVRRVNNRPSGVRLLLYSQLFILAAALHAAAHRWFTSRQKKSTRGSSSSHPQSANCDLMRVSLILHQVRVCIPLGRLACLPQSMI